MPSNKENKGFNTKMIQSGYTIDEIHKIVRNLGMGNGHQSVNKEHARGKYTSGDILDYVPCKCTNDYVCHPCNLNRLREKYNTL